MMRYSLLCRTGRVLAGALILGLAACEQPPAQPAEPPPPPAPPVPPSPDLPMTAAKARQIMGDLSLTCTQLATLKADMLVCDERVGRRPDHEALRTELRDLRWNLQALPAAEATGRCDALIQELRARPKPQACWDLGNG